eukprot:TRINITY_DN573_c0_g1_i1.p1 TRINITY_DN573_c0_g1~~TRINITY_DN573_c0_g1_i1.p1  ORF type:complete len:147 (-),score=23.02 TRINITY_DN573_c0_g1_i1:248-688(-)
MCIRDRVSTQSTGKFLKPQTRQTHANMIRKVYPRGNNCTYLSSNSSLSLILKNHGRREQVRKRSVYKKNLFYRPTSWIVPECCASLHTPMNTTQFLMNVHKDQSEVKESVLDRSSSFSEFEINPYGTNMIAARDLVQARPTLLVEM